MTVIGEMVKAGETEKTILLSPGTSTETLGKAVCSLLNSKGGRVLWGFTREGVPLGVPRPEFKEAELNVAIMTGTVPRPLISISVEEYRGKRVILIEVPEGADKPYFYRNVLWVRVGRNNLRASEDKSAEMVEGSALERSRWGREPMPGFELDDCDAQELEDARDEIAKTGRFGIDVPAESDELLRRLYLVRGEHLSNAAMLLFAREPLAWAPNVVLRIISYAGDKQGRALHEQTLQGPAVRILRQAISVIQQQTGFTGRFRFGRLEREDSPAYALFALREGLVNAMAHRDYEASSGQLRVEIFPDHLMIQNPGKLPDGWTEKDIITKEESQPTNPDIARVFYLRALMERLGLGGRKLREACIALNAKPPVWKAKDGTVSLTLYPAPRLKEMLRLQPRMLEFLHGLKRGAEFKAEQYAKGAGVSLRQARRDLDFLAEAGEITRHGQGPSTLYRREEGGT